jgi:hypothetical protein
MKRFVLAIALACALSSITMAGEIHSTGAPAPGEIPTSGVSSPGDVPSTGAPSPGDIPSGGLSVVLMILELAF